MPIKKYVSLNISKFTQLVKKLGPGLVTGASDDDPSGIATYSQAGAQFGMATLWTALITFPLMVSIQEMCARIGIVTRLGLAANIKEHYSKSILYIVLILTIPAIVLNIGADLAGMGAVANLLMPKIPVYFFTIVFAFFLQISIIYFSYNKIASILKYLCLSLLLYIVVPFLSHQNFWTIIKNTLIPTIHFKKEYISILVAILGTTISPYLFFWQTTMEVEDKKSKKHVVNKKVISEMNKDVSVGMFSSNLVMYFIILTTGTVLYPAGIHQINTVEQAAKALQPIAGELSYLLFALGVVGTGLLAVPVLLSSISFILTETFDLNKGLEKKFRNAKAFYFIMIVSLLLGLTIDFVGLSPIQSLIYTAILYGLCSPILILVVLHISNNKKIMGRYTNTRNSNVWGIITFLVMTVAAGLLLILQFI